MSEKKTTISETEYRDGDMMEKVRAKMLERGTGQMILNMSQGRICSVVWREKTYEVAGVNGNVRLGLTTVS